MATDDLPVLYVKPGCPWCHEVEEYLSQKGVNYRQRDVISNPSAMQEMQRLSGQSRAPTLDWHGQVLADFGVEELVPFLRKQNVKLEDS
jgi:glutaredoxin